MPQSVQLSPAQLVHCAVRPCLPLALCVILDCSHDVERSLGKEDSIQAKDDNEVDDRRRLPIDQCPRSWATSSRTDRPLSDDRPLSSFGWQLVAGALYLRRVVTPPLYCQNAPS